MFCIMIINGGVVCIMNENRGVVCIMNMNVGYSFFHQCDWGVWFTS